MTIYVVKQGDTIQSIANAFGVSTDQLIKDNGITNVNKLVVGQSIIILTPDQPVEKLGTVQINGYAYPFVEADVLRSILPHSTYLTPFSYGFTTDGTLVELDDAKLLALAKEYKVAPLMHVSTMTAEGNFDNSLSHAILTNIDAQNNLINNILTNMKNKNYYGMDIDFEFVLPEDKDGYISFVKNITTKLNAQGYEVMVALAPKTSATQAGLLYEAHDYKGIGAAANYVLLMTYEWGFTYGPPMAVSPINKMREVLDYAVTEIEPSKIFMGLPNYAYDWPLPFVKNETKAESIGNVQAVERAAEFNTVIQFDEVAQTPFYHYYDYTGKQHEVWFDDARSMNAKLRLISEYKLKGAGYWNFMRVFPQNWTLAETIYNIYKVPGLQG